MTLLEFKAVMRNIFVGTEVLFALLSACCSIYILLAGHGAFHERKLKRQMNGVRTLNQRRKERATLIRQNL